MRVRQRSLMVAAPESLSHAPAAASVAAVQGSRGQVERVARSFSASSCSPPSARCLYPGATRLIDYISLFIAYRATQALTDPCMKASLMRATTDPHSASATLSSTQRTVSVATDSQQLLRGKAPPAKHTRALHRSARTYASPSTATASAPSGATTAGLPVPSLAISMR